MFQSGRLGLEPEGWTLASVALLGILGPYTFLVSPVIAAQLAVQLHWGGGAIGALFATEFGGAAAVTFPSVYLLRKYPARRVGLVFGLLFVVTNLMALCGTSFSWLLANRFLAGAAGGVLSVTCLLAAARSANPHRAFALWTGAQTVAAALGLLLLPHLFAATGVRGVYGLLAAGTLALLFLVRGFADSPLAFPRETRRTLRSAPWILAALFAFYLAISGAWAFVGLPGLKLGLSEHGLGNLTALAMFAAVIGSLLASKSGSLTYRHRLVPVGLMVLVGCLAAMSLATTTLAYGVTVVAFQIGWSFVLAMLMGALAESDEGGALVIISNVIIGAGASIGPLLAGAAIDRWDSYAAVGAEAATLLLVAAFACLQARRMARLPILGL